MSKIGVLYIFLERDHLKLLIFCMMVDGNRVHYLRKNLYPGLIYVGVIE